MKIMVFAEGTIIMHRAGAGGSREEISQQVVAGTDPSIHDFATYMPIGDAVSKLQGWQEQGATILYLTSRTTAAQVADISLVLQKYGFPAGRLFFRAQGETYAGIAEQEMPDVLIEDDCESLGGEQKITVTHVRPEARARIRSIVVKEFGGIDHLPSALTKLAPE